LCGPNDGGICEDWVPADDTLYKDGHCPRHQPSRPRSC
jgi:hypothetical protein